MATSFSICTKKIAIPSLGSFLRVCCILGFLWTQWGWSQDRESDSTPKEAIQQERLIRFEESIRLWIEQAIAEKKMPGCVVGIGNSNGLFFEKAYGLKNIETGAPMTLDTVFDMASITKPVATATSIMQLVEQGQLRLKEKVASYLPEFGNNGKQDITIEHLLLHTSGLIPDNPMADYHDGPEKAWERVCELPLTAPLGTAFKYSDVNFIVLGKLVEKISSQSLDDYSRRNIFEPLGMTESGFRPGDRLRERCAPTEKRGDGWIQGEVHDPRAFALGGIAGHAGLFSTLRDLSRYAQAMLRIKTQKHPKDASDRVLSPYTLDVMTRGYLVPNGIRGLGWDKRSGYSTNRGDLFSEAAFGHGGFTGTVLWIDPGSDLFFIFLSNRVHPDGKGLINPLAGRIANLLVRDFGRVLDLVNTQAQAERTDVRSGIDVLQARNFLDVQNLRLGLITNHTGRNREGVSTVKLLAEAPNCKLTKLFSPEHGFEGKLDISKVSNTQDAQTGLTVYSLYGETRKPTAEMLESIDAIVFDIQDIGARFYTYISTMGEAMKAAADHHKKFIVLDRPNPIGGESITGPMLDPGKESFVGFHNLPVRHGMTIGELAKMFKEELKLDMDLHVIQCEGWSRSQTWDETGIPWVNPSPNMRSLTQAFLYPGIGLLETTNLSVGRGTDTPFQVIGAPWIDHRRLVEELKRFRLPGVVFVPIEFVPSSSKFANEKCQGVEIIITDRDRFESVRTGLALAVALRGLYPDAWETKNLNRLLGNQEVYESIVAGKLDVSTEESYAKGLMEFRQRRQRVLLYR